MEHPPSISGDGVLLRRWRDADVDAVLAVADDDVAHRFGMPAIPWPREQVERWRDAWEGDGCASYLVGAGSEVVGRVAARWHDAGHRAALTWVTFAPYRGRGHARAAVTALTEWASAHVHGGRRRPPRRQRPRAPAADVVQAGVGGARGSGRGRRGRAVGSREAREELDLAVRPRSLLALDTWPADIRAPDTTLALLDGGTHPPELVEHLRFTDGEIVAAHWCDRAAVRARAGHRLVPGLLAVLDALDDGRLPGAPLLLRAGEPAGAGRRARPAGASPARSMAVTRRPELQRPAAPPAPGR